MRKVKSNNYELSITNYELSIINYQLSIIFLTFAQNYSSMKILILNGPNINLIGRREPGVYGVESFDDYFQTLCSDFPDVELTAYQSNVEGELINKLHEVGFSYDGIIFNAGAYTHTSIALQDAIRAITTPVIEVHISNVTQREAFRHTSMISPACKGIIIGFGLKSYRLALQSFMK